MTAKNDLSEMRRDYHEGSLDEVALDPDPITELRKWLELAAEKKVVEPNAMTLATVDANGQPNARIVLCKGLDERGVVFYTNHRSHKGTEADANPRAALDFYWKELARQVRIQGAVERVGPSESDAYFASRPRGSQLGAWASEHQSAPVTRQELDDRLHALEKKYEGTEVPRPPFWGGYRVIPHRFEFWLGATGRLHDCFAYARDGGVWIHSRVSP
ncbi:MAG: pyridoxamine 5'-phosphate oxidase [Polyangiaceae bacterium]